MSCIRTIEMTLAQKRVYNTIMGIADGEDVSYNDTITFIFNSKEVLDFPLTLFAFHMLNRSNIVSAHNYKKCLDIVQYSSVFLQQVSTKAYFRVKLPCMLSILRDKRGLNTD